MYKLNESKMFFDVADGQAVVINFVTGMYYGTTPLGSVILDNLIAGKQPDNIARKIKTFQGCPEDFEQKLKLFIDELLQKEILIPGETVSDEVTIDEQSASKGFDLTLNEFAEVKDLILADPVHDVDVEKGWPIFDKDFDKNKDK